MLLLLFYLTNEFTQKLCLRTQHCDNASLHDCETMFQSCMNEGGIEECESVFDTIVHSRFQNPIHSICIWLSETNIKIDFIYASTYLLFGLVEIRWHVLNIKIVIMADSICAKFRHFKDHSEKLWHTFVSWHSNIAPFFVYVVLCLNKSQNRCRIEAVDYFGGKFYQFQLSWSRVLLFRRRTHLRFSSVVNIFQNETTTLIERAKVVKL